MREVCEESSRKVNRLPRKVSKNFKELEDDGSRGRKEERQRESVTHILDWIVR
jgi:hypothetical protein